MQNNRVYSLTGHRKCLECKDAIVIILIMCICSWDTLKCKIRLFEEP